MSSPMQPGLRPLSCQKQHFNLDPRGEGYVYLNSAYMGPLPTAALMAGQQALVARAFPVSISASDFFSHADRVRGRCAELVNASPNDVCFIPTAAYGMAMVAKVIEAEVLARKNARVLMLGEQFPSGVYPWRNWRSKGVVLDSVSAPAAPWSGDLAGQPSRGRLWNQAVIDAISADTALVSIEQAHWADGTLFDLQRIGERCRAVGAVFVIDATQTVGAMPLDFRAIGADAVIVHSYKSMLCNYGLGFAALGPRFANGRPLEESWLMREGSEDFSRLIDYQDNYAAGMRRYDSSLRASPVLIHMLDACTQLLLKWQPERIRTYLLGIERDFVQTIRGHGFQIADETDRAANIFGIALPSHLSPERVRATLAEHKILVSVRGSAVRISPHVYNDDDDLARLADVLIGMARK